MWSFLLCLGLATNAVGQTIDDLAADIGQQEALKRLGHCAGALSGMSLFGSTDQASWAFKVRSQGLRIAALDYIDRSLADNSGRAKANFHNSYMDTNAIFVDRYGESVILGDAGKFAESMAYMQTEFQACERYLVYGSDPDIELRAKAEVAKSERLALKMAEAYRTVDAPNHNPVFAGDVDGFPEEIGHFILGDVTNNEIKHPGLGVTGKYSASNSELSVYIYNRKQGRIPIGSSNPVVIEQFKAALNEIQVLEQRGYYKDVQVRSEAYRIGNIGEPSFVCIDIEYSLDNVGPLQSVLCMTGYSDNFLKLRITGKSRNELEQDIALLFDELLPLLSTNSQASLN